jgi:hypothetical protein
MVTSNAGKFELSSSAQGYPHWVTIKSNGKEIIRVHHNQLSDLEYAVKRHRELLRAEATLTDSNEI